MARTVVTQGYTCSFDQAQQAIVNTLMQNGYKETQLKTGEVVWKKGTGLLTAMHFIKVEFAENAFALSGWVQAGVGSVGGNEMDLEGFVASVPKKSVKKTMNQILSLFQQ